MINKLSENYSKEVRKAVAIGGILLLLALLLGCIILAFLFKGQLNQNEFMSLAYKNNQSELVHLNQKMAQVRDSLGRERSKTVVLEGDKKMFKALLEAQDKFLIDKLKDFDIKLKDLKSITNLKVETAGQFVTVTRDSVITTYFTRDSVVIDTVQTFIKIIDYQEPDGWFTMKGTITADTVRFNPKFKEEFDIAVYKEPREKKYWIDPVFLRKRITQVEIINKNPYSSTKGLKHIIQKD